MRRFYFLLFSLVFLLLFCESTHATTLTGTVVSPNGTAYAGSPVTATFIPSPFGLPINTPAPVTGITNSSGTFSIIVTDNTTINPLGSRWDIKVCFSGQTPCAEVFISISGASLDISALLNANASNPIANGSGTFAQVQVPFSATPSFVYVNGSAETTFTLQITGNVTSSTMSGNFIAGSDAQLIICQDGVGNRTFAFPATFLNVPALASGASACTAGTWIYCGASGLGAACPANSWQNTDQGPAGAASAFNAITSGTNTSAAMILGSGSSLTTSGTGTISSTTGFSAISDGVHAGYSNFVGNTANFAVTANTVGFMGPSQASFTGYALQLPSTGPTTALPLLSCVTPIGSVSACTFVAASSSAAWSAITSGANAQTGAFSTAAPWTFSVAGAASTPAINITGLPFVGTGTTSTPQLYLNGGTAPTNWNVNGTYIGINTASGFNGNVFDYHSNGSGSFFSLSAGANINMTGSVNANAAAITTSSSSASYLTASNCSSSASPAVCGSAAAGSVAVPTGTNATLVVNTTAVTANSQIFVQSDDTLGTKLGITCNSTLASLIVEPVVSARVGGTSFTITISGTTTTNPVCLSYFIIN